MVVDETMSDHLTKVTAEEKEQMQQLYPEGSFQQIFLDQQKQAMKQKDIRAVHWHLLMIRFSWYLRHHSGKAYEALWQSGCITLPSQQTLQDYSHSGKTGVGFSLEVDHH